MQKSTKNFLDISITGYDTDYVFKTIEKSGYFYEGKLLNKWTKYFDRAKVVFDIGANLGNHSLYWSINLDCQAIYSFEPFKPNFDLLCENIKQNNIKNIIPLNAAVGRKKSKAVIKKFDETNYGATSIEISQKLDANSVDVISIDSFVAEKGISEIGFVKIDTEGFEENVLLGMKEVLRTMSPALWIEVSAESHKNVFDILLPLGYKIIDVSGFNVLFLPAAKCRDQNIKCYDESNYITNMFIYLKKVNIYYGNYIKLKDSICNKDKQLQDILKNYNALKEKNNEASQKYRSVTENYNAIKSKNEQLHSRNVELVSKVNEISSKYKTIQENYSVINEQNVEVSKKYQNILEKYDALKAEKDKGDNEYHTLFKKYNELVSEHNQLVQKCHEINQLYCDQLKDNYQINSDEIDILNKLGESYNSFKEEVLILSNRYGELEELYRNGLQSEYTSNINEIAILSELKAFVKKLESQNNYLKSENAEYQRKMQIIKDTFIGKILVWGYHKYKSIRIKFSR